MAVSTTCMAEVIGDDLNAFITNARKDGRVPMDFPIPFAHTPSFVGSHTTGWDNMEEGVLRYFTLNDEMEGKTVGSNGKLNIITGFETYLGNFRVIKRMLKEMGVEYTMLCDPDCAIRKRCSIPRPTANSACTLAAPGSRRSRTPPTPSIPFCCNLGPCPRPRSTYRKPGSIPLASSASRWA